MRSTKKLSIPERVALGMLLLSLLAAAVSACVVLMAPQELAPKNFFAGSFGTGIVFFIIFGLLRIRSNLSRAKE